MTRTPLENVRMRKKFTSLRTGNSSFWKSPISRSSLLHNTILFVLCSPALSLFMGVFSIWWCAPVIESTDPQQNRDLQVTPNTHLPILLSSLDNESGLLWDQNYPQKSPENPQYSWSICSVLRSLILNSIKQSFFPWQEKKGKKDTSHRISNTKGSTQIWWLFRLSRKERNHI